MKNAFKGVCVHFVGWVDLPYFFVAQLLSMQFSRHLTNENKKTAYKMELPL